jgi:hypothetical protein
VVFIVDLIKIIEHFFLYCVSENLTWKVLLLSLSDAYRGEGLSQKA